MMKKMLIVFGMIFLFAVIALVVLLKKQSWGEKITDQAIDGKVHFETKENEFGKLTITSVTRKKYKGTVLVIPLVPIPIGEKEDVDVHLYFFTSPNGKTRELKGFPDGSYYPKSLRIAEIVDGYFFVSNPLDIAQQDKDKNANVLLDRSYLGELKAIAQTLNKNKSQIESLMGKSLSVVAVVEQVQIEELQFFPPENTANKNKRLGFEYKGSDFKELGIIQESERVNKKWIDTLGYISLGKGKRLLEVISALELKDFKSADFRQKDLQEEILLNYTQYEPVVHLDSVYPSEKDLFYALKGLPEFKNSKIQKVEGLKTIT